MINLLILKNQFKKDELREKVMKDGLNAYIEAKNLAKDLPVMNETVLGLSLNMSLFYYEVVNERKNAIKISEECTQKIDKELPNFDVDNENNKVIMALVGLIKENLKNWKMEEEEQ